MDLNRRLFLQSTGWALAGGFSGLILPPAKALAAPEFAETATFQPRALMATWSQDPTTTMTLQWLSENESDGVSRSLWYRRSGTTTWHEAKHLARRFPQTDLWQFRAELSGLEPDSLYRIRVGLDSPQESVRTMPAKATNPITFVTGGDSGSGTASRRTNRLAGAQSPGFVLMGGDLAYENGRSASAFLKYMDQYSEDVRNQDGHLIPLIGCLGNHEVDGGYDQPREKAPFFYSLFDGLFPDTGYAALDFGDYLSLVLLDSGHTSPVAGDQTDWLQQTLQQREMVPNLFVANHVPMYPCVRHAEGDRHTVMRQHWSPLIERYNVDAVFEHHDHAFKRTHRMRDGLVDKRGILYLGDGSWGQIRSPESPEQRPFLAKSTEAYHLSVHRIEGADRFHMAMSDKGQIMDIVQTQKMAHNR